MRIKEEETYLILHEHDDDGDDVKNYTGRRTVIFRVTNDGLLSTYCQIPVANL